MEINKQEYISENLIWGGLFLYLPFLIVHITFFPSHFFQTQEVIQLTSEFQAQRISDSRDRPFRGSTSTVNISSIQNESSDMSANNMVIMSLPKGQFLNLM